MLYHPTELVKSQDVIVRVGAIPLASGRPVITQSGATFTVSGAPTLFTLQAATTASVAFNDGNQEFYLLGGGGFADSVITTSQATASITSYFQKDVDGTVFLPNSFDEAFQVISASRYDKNHEVYVEINKQLGVSGTTFYYDRVAFTACVMNYNESYPADNLVEVTFDLVSRSRIGIHQSATSSGSIIPVAPN
jgi:dihydrofolate reductase